MLSASGDSVEINVKSTVGNIGGNVVDLTTQDGSNAKEMVMYASADYSTEPSIEFQNETDLNIVAASEMRGDVDFVFLNRALSSYIRFFLFSSCRLSF